MTPKSFLAVRRRFDVRPAWSKRAHASFFYPSEAKPNWRPAGAMASCHQLAYPAIFESRLVGQHRRQSSGRATACRSRGQMIDRCPTKPLAALRLKARTTATHGGGQPAYSRKIRSERRECTTVHRGGSTPPGSERRRQLRRQTDATRTARLDWRSRGSVRQPARQAGCEAGC
jgi:hypothetical protein